MKLKTIAKAIISCWLFWAIAWGIAIRIPYARVLMIWHWLRGRGGIAFSTKELAPLGIKGVSWTIIQYPKAWVYNLARNGKAEIDWQNGYFVMLAYPWDGGFSPKGHSWYGPISPVLLFLTYYQQFWGQERDVYVIIPQLDHMAGPTDGGPTAYQEMSLFLHFLRQQGVQPEQTVLHGFSLGASALLAAMLREEEKMQRNWNQSCHALHLASPTSHMRKTIDGMLSQAIIYLPNHAYRCWQKISGLGPLISPYQRTDWSNALGELARYWVVEPGFWLVSFGQANFDFRATKGIKDPERLEACLPRNRLVSLAQHDFVCGQKVWGKLSKERGFRLFCTPRQLGQYPISWIQNGQIILLSPMSKIVQELNLGRDCQGAHLDQVKDFLLGVLNDLHHRSSITHSR